MGKGATREWTLHKTRKTLVKNPDGSEKRRGNPRREGEETVPHCDRSSLGVQGTSGRQKGQKNQGEVPFDITRKKGQERREGTGQPGQYVNGRTKKDMGKMAKK